MTSPFPPITQRNAIGSEVDQQEWDLMLKRRKQLVEEITNRMNLANHLGSMDVADTVASTHNVTGQNEDGSPTWFQEMTAPPPGHQLNQLIGAARYYGIADPEKIPPMQLKQIVEAQRLKTQPTVNNDGVIKKAADTVAEGVVAMGLGTVNELMAVAQRLPFVGDAFARMKVIQGIDQYMGLSGEAVTANMTQEEASGFRTASRIGGMVGYALPAAAAWEAAGLVGNIGFVANAARVARLGPMTRIAVQGAASAAILETGDPAGEAPRSLQEKMTNIAMGAGIAVGFHYLNGVVPKVFEKIRGAFRGRTDPWSPGYEPVKPPGQEDAEWYFEADHQLAGPGGGAGAGPGGSPRPGELPGAPRLTAETGGPYGNDPFVAQRSATARMSEQPVPQGPDYTVEPLTQELPGQPSNRLMSPERAAIEERLANMTEQRDVARRMAETDPLTGGGNKTALTRAQAAVDADPDLGWVVFDGKQFKAVNDAHGHVVGDGVLANFSRAISQAAQELNVPNRVFRQGGDEFAAVVPKDQMQALLSRATELSYQKVGNVETKLNGYAAETFADADLQLMQNKRGGKFREEDVQAEIDRALYNQYGSDFRSGQLLPQEMGFEAGTTINRVGGGFELTPPAGQVRRTFARPEDAYNEAIAGPFTPEQRAIANRWRAEDAARAAGNPNYPVQLGKGGATPELSVGESAQEGALLSKQAVLVETGDVPFLAAQSEIGIPSVAQAQLARNPGGIAVLRGVGDAGKTIRQLVQAQTESKLMPHTFRLVERGGSMDLLVTTGLPITNKRVAQYKEHGFFEGQSAVVNGQEVVVKNPGSEFTSVTDPYTGEVSQVRTETVLPGNGTSPLSAEHISEVYPKAGDLYNDFISYTMDAMNAGSETLGIVDKPTWLSHETATQLPRMLDEFLDSRGISDPAQRLAIESFFNVQRVEDYRMEAPQEAAELTSIVRELNTAVIAKPPVTIPIEDIAGTKGFDYVPMPEQQGGTLVDKLSDLRVPVESKEAALEFLRSFNREVPDYTPETEIPFELTSAGPHGDNPGHDLEPVAEGGSEQIVAMHNRDLSRVENGVELLNQSLNELAQMAAGGGSGGGSPPPPPPRSGGLPGPVPAPQIPPGERSLGAAFAQAGRERPTELYKTLQLLDSAWLRYGEPFRRVTIQIQDALQNMGIEEGKLWEHYSDMVTAVAKKHNEEHPWMQEASDIFGQFTKRRWLRDGTVTRIQEISDYNQKIKAMMDAGYTPRDMAAQKRLGDFNDRFFSYMVDSPEINLNYSRYVFGYMSRVRMRQGMTGVSDPYADTDGMLPREFQFFAEMARTGNLQMRQMDARVLTATLVRGAMFQKFAAEPWQKMVQAWDDPRVPSKLREIVTDWLRVVKTGRDPGYDAAIQGVRHVLNRFGVPITDSEVAGIWGGAFSNIYRGALGGRPDAIFRDSIQPFLAGTRIGFKPIVAAYNRFLSGADARSEMWNRAREGGWVEEGQVQVPIAEVFEGSIQDLAGADLLTPRMQQRREMLAKIGDLMYALTPRRLRGGIQGTKIDPLLGYTKLGELNRVISGDAGWQVASDALADYQFEMGRLSRGESQLGSGEMIVDKMDQLMARLMDKSQADVYPMPIQKRFRELVQNGDMEGAANLMANEAANSQFRYGSKESSIGIRKAGTTGRIGMMFGSFTQQYIAAMREQFLNVPASPTRTAKVAAMGLRHGTIAGLIGLAGAYTGWKFSKWFWHNSLAFGGGPLAQGIYNTAMNVTGRIAQATDQPLSPAQAQAVAQSDRTTIGQDIAGAANRLNPYASTIETIDRYSTAIGGMNAPEVTARLTVTGERGLGPDFRQFLAEQPVVSPDDLNNALAGDANAAAKFSPEERQFIERLRMVPVERRFQVYMGWRDSRGPRGGGAGRGAGGRY